MVEAGREGQLIRCFLQALLDDLGRIRGTLDEAAAQLRYRWRLDEDAQGPRAIVRLDVAAPFDIDVEHHVLATLGLVSTCDFRVP